MDTNQDAESYWNRSASKAFSFDDDVEDDNASLPSSRLEYNVLADDNISEASFDNTANTLNLTIKSVLSEADLELILNEQSHDSDIIPKSEQDLDSRKFLDEYGQCLADLFLALGKGGMLKGIAPDEELKLLRRKLQYLVHTPSLKLTAHKLLHGKQCPLEVYKSLNDKEDLLDEVLQNGDGNAVVGVILFLQRTLNKKQFYRILRSRSKACDHYINYLIQTKNKEALEILTMVGRHQESSIVQFKAEINRHTDISIKKQKLKQFIDAYFTDPGIISIYYQIFTNSLNLMELIEKSKSNLNEDISTESSVIEVLYSACARHKWKDSDTTSYLSPYKIAADYQISAAQFEWTALNERANSQSYLDLGGIFEKSSWNLITKQKQFHISFSLETAIKRLSVLNAPLPVLHFFLSKLSNPHQKLVLSKKVKCTKGVIDALVALKDVQVLENFRDTLVNGSEERFYCEQALTNMNKKWSTEGLKIIR